MEQIVKGKKELIAIFTKTGFTVDYEIDTKKNMSEEDKKNQETWYTRFLEDRYKALWDIDFQELLKKSMEEKMQSMLKNADKKSKRVIDDTDVFDLFGL